MDGREHDQPVFLPALRSLLAPYAVRFESRVELLP
jgi:hypothetical protein